MALWLNSSCTCVRTWVWVPSTCIKLSKSSFPTGRWGWRYQNPGKCRGQLAWCAQQWTTRELVSNQLEDEARQPGLPSDLHSCATVLMYPHSHKWTCKHVHTSHMHEKVLYLKKSQHRHTYLWFFFMWSMQNRQWPPPERASRLAGGHKQKEKEQWEVTALPKGTVGWEDVLELSKDTWLGGTDVDLSGLQMLMPIHAHRQTHPW